MILSTVEKRRALDEGWLIVEPQLQPRIPGAEGSDCPCQTIAIDLTLGDAIAGLKEGLPFDVNRLRFAVCCQSSLSLA